MGCCCFRSNLVIKSKIPPVEGEISVHDFENEINQNQRNPLQPRNNNSQSNNDSSWRNNARESRSHVNEHNQINNLNALDLNRNLNQVVGNNYNNSNNSNLNNLIQQQIRQNPFLNYEPYLISKNDPNFNYKELPNEYLGRGLKKLKGYISPITWEELQKVRENFWTSRIEGDRDIWALLQGICSDQGWSNDDIETMLRALGVIPYKDCINVTYDSKGAIYEIPNYCINDPSQYEIPEIEYSKAKPPEKTVNIYIRQVIKQYSISIKNTRNILFLKESIVTQNKKIKEKDRIPDWNHKRIRLFFGGKEWHNDKEIWFYGIDDDAILQMLVKEDLCNDWSRIEEKNNSNKESTWKIRENNSDVWYKVNNTNENNLTKEENKKDAFTEKESILKMNSVSEQVKEEDNPEII